MFPMTVTLQRLRVPASLSFWSFGKTSWISRYPQTDEFKVIPIQCRSSSWYCKVPWSVAGRGASGFPPDGHVCSAAAAESISNASRYLNIALKWAIK